MKKKILGYLLVFAIPFLCYSKGVSAIDVDHSDTSCSVTSQAYVRKLAADVKASYEVLTDENGNKSVKISVYNIVDDIFIMIKDTADVKGIGEMILPTYNNVENGTYSFVDTDIDQVKTYQITVRANGFGCRKNFRNFTITKPKFNKFSTYDVCKHDEVQDYFYCKAWITKDITLDDYDVIAKIDEQINSARRTTTNGICESCDAEMRNKAKLEQIALIKKYIIIGLSIGIVIDLIVIAVLIYNIKRYSL